MSAVKRSSVSVLTVALLYLSGCASPPIASKSSLDQKIAAADLAYRGLRQDRVTGYNSAIAEITKEMERISPAEFRSRLDGIGVSLDAPTMKLPLTRYHIVRRRGQIVDKSAVGVPMLIEYDTKRAPLHPPEGMLMPATALYVRTPGEARVSLVSEKRTVILDGNEYPVAVDYAAPGLVLGRRAKRLARSGFMSMIRPTRMERKPQIYLIDPYDPDKIPLLMVHGLQSTPVAFLALVNALHVDAEMRTHFQIWHFHYATGTPVMVNALTLREELAKTIRQVDPLDQHVATKRIVVLGHSMGGVISHTLASSSGDKLWSSLFTVPPSKLRGDRDHIAELERVMFFQRNRRVARLIFLATPHRGSGLSDNWIGAIGKSLTRLPAFLQTGLTEIGKANAEAMTPEGAAFYKRESFSAIRTLSSRSPALMALSKLPIAVPFHSVMGQKGRGRREQGSDGVVPFASSHLDGAASEVVVAGGHKVFNHPDAIREVNRILRLELRSASR